MNPRFVHAKDVPTWEKKGDPNRMVDLLHLWGLQLLNLASYHQVGLIAGGPEDGMQNLVERFKQSANPETLVLGDFHDTSSTCTKAIDRNGLVLFSGSSDNSGSYRLLHKVRVHECSKLILFNFELLSGTEIRKLALVRDRMMSDGRPFGVLAIGVGDPEQLNAKLQKLSCRVVMQQPDNLDRNEIDLLVKSHGLSLTDAATTTPSKPSKQMELPGMARGNVLTAIELIEKFSRRAGTIEAIARHYHGQHGTSLLPAKLLPILVDLDPNFLGRLKALEGKKAQRKTKHRGKPRRSTRQPLAPKRPPA